MTSLSDTMTQQTNLQNQLPIGFKGFTSTVHEQQHHQHQQHQQHIAIEKSLARRLEAIKRLPFLSGYPVTDCSLPFVVDDIEKKPTVALVVKGPVGPAVYFYVNEAFCRQFKYSYVRTHLSVLCHTHIVRECYLLHISIFLCLSLLHCLCMG